MSTPFVGSRSPSALVTVRCPEAFAPIFRELGFRAVVATIEHGERFVVLVWERP